MNHLTKLRFNFFHVAAFVIITGLIMHYRSETTTTELTEAQAEVIRLIALHDYERAEFQKAFDNMMPDTVIVEIETKQKADEKRYDNRVIDIVGMDVTETINISNRVVSKGDSIRSGHLNLVHAR